MERQCSSALRAAWHAMCDAAAGTTVYRVLAKSKPFSAVVLLETKLRIRPIKKDMEGSCFGEG